MFYQLIRSAMDANEIASVIISISLMLFLGFAMTRITKRLRLPNVTAYILTGILIGPYCADLIPAHIIDSMGFLSDIALAFIAFGTGEFFKVSTLKQGGAKVVILTVFEACMASVIVFFASYCLLGVDLVFCIVLSALASATAPASTMMTIRQTGAHGEFVNTLLQVVALDDVIGLVEYSVAISLAVAISTGSHMEAGSILLPIAVNLAVLTLGGLFGLFLDLLMAKRSTDNRLIVSISLLFAFCGVCALLGVSPLLGCMAMGTVYVNVSKDEKLFKQLNYFTPPILLLFFVSSGLGFQLDALVGTSAAMGATSLLTIGVFYFFARIIGKYAGCFLGCLATRRTKEIRNYMGLALIPQAGVAIGLAAMGARTLGGEAGVALETVILASSVLYELIGPACAKLSLYLSKSYSAKLEDIIPEPSAATGSQEPAPNAVELLIQRIQTIQEELSRPSVSEEEQAFLEAAEDQMAALSYIHAGPVHNARRY